MRDLFGTFQITCNYRNLSLSFVSFLELILSTNETDKARAGVLCAHPNHPIPCMNACSKKLKHVHPIRRQRRQPDPNLLAPNTFSPILHVMNSLICLELWM